jgi:hypothetical protein
MNDLNVNSGSYPVTGPSKAPSVLPDIFYHDYARSPRDDQDGVKGMQRGIITMAIAPQSRSMGTPMRTKSLKR